MRSAVEFQEDPAAGSRLQDIDRSPGATEGQELDVIEKAFKFREQIQLRGI